MSSFPKTPTALLTRIAADATGGDEAVWTEFFELYEPAVRDFLRRKFGIEDSDDLVMAVFEKLVTVLRNGRFDRNRGKFRSYLATFIYNEAISAARKNVVREDFWVIGRGDEDAAVTPSVGDELDAEWIESRHRAVVEHVLGHTALSQATKAVYRELEESGDDCAAIAKRMGVSAANVRQIKSRIGRMVSALEKRLGND